MAFIGGRRRRIAAQPEGDGLPLWLIDYFLVGLVPEFGTPERAEFTRLRYVEQSIPSLYLAHRAELIREAQRLGFVRAEEPFGEMFATDGRGRPLPLPPGVERVVDGDSSPWFASRLDPGVQAILRQQLAEARGQWDGDAA